MSFYRTLIAVVASMSLATAVCAADEATATTTTTTDTTKTMQVADSSSTTQEATPATEQEKVNVNKATAKELMKVQGLNAAKARAIVSYRTKNGDFKSVDDLKNVKAFKKTTDDNFKKIADQLTVG